MQTQTEKQENNKIMSGELPVTFLICVGRAGSGFLHSLLDSHPQVLMLPMELAFHRFWIDGRCDQITDAKTMVNYWMKESKLRRLKLGNDMDYERLEYDNCDVQLFEKRFFELLHNKELSRKNVFLAIHQAYGEATKQDLTKIKMIIEFPALVYRMEDVVEDFPNAHFIQIIRDHRAVYLSTKQIYLNTRGGLFDHYGTCFRERFVIAVLFKQFLSVFQRYDLWREKRPTQFSMVRLEDLHATLEPSMRNVALWLGIDFQPLLLDSTLSGKPWKGNSSFKEAVTGSDMKVAQRWMHKLSRREIALIEFLFAGHMKKFDYALTEPRCRNVGIFLKSLMPFRGEFFNQIANREPTRPLAKKLNDIHPWILTAGRYGLETVLIVFRVLAYPFNRWYLSKLIFDKSNPYRQS